MEESIHLRLKSENNIVACIDNNQKGYNKSYQRYGKSNNFIKVTGCVIRRYQYSSLHEGDYTDRVPITYQHQVIPSSHMMPNLEMISLQSVKDIYKFFHQLTTTTESNERDRAIFPISEAVAIPDFTGKRIHAYENLCKVFQKVELLRQSVSSIYCRSNDKTKFVPFTPENWKSDSLLELYKSLNQLKNTSIFKRAKLFQYDIMKQWNNYSEELSQFIVPGVFLHDEITTDGYGKCLVELLTKHSILLKKDQDETNYGWVLAPDFMKKNIILCLDGLSLDRHRCFSKKLLNLPLTFTRAYQQSLIFQEALTRVVEIIGPLHTSFHILQCLYSVYNCILKCTQRCLGWKKLHFNKISDNYRLCVHMIDIVYEETNRMLMHNFLLEYCNSESNTTSFDDAELAIDIALKFDTYINNKCKDSKDERWKLICCFYKLASYFKLYENSMKMGGSIGMEFIETKFLGFFCC